MFFISRKFFLLLGSVLISIFIFIFFMMKIIKGNNEILIPSILFLIYILYFCWITYEEYRECKLDKIHGLQEEILKFNYSRSGGIRVGIANKTPSQTIIIFERLNETKDTIALTGNLSKINLVKGQCYKVSYTTGTKILVQVEKVKK